MSEKPYKCPVCNGTGKIENKYSYGTTVPCYSTCQACYGRGIVWREYKTK